MSGRLTLLAIAAACAGKAPPPAQPTPQPVDQRAADRARADAEEARLNAEYERDEGTCDDESFDVGRHACLGFCPSYPVLARGWVQCDSKCPRDSPRPEILACQQTMACPAPPDRRVFACLRVKEQVWPPCDRRHPVLANPRCDGYSRVPGAAIEHTRLENGRYVLRIVPCGNRGVAAGWRGHLVNRDSGADVAGTDFEVTEASDDQCTAVTDAAIEPTLADHSTRVWMDPP